MYRDAALTADGVINRRISEVGAASRAVRLVLVALSAVLITALGVAAPPKAEAASVARYSSGVVITLTGTETAVVAASGAMYPILAVAGSALGPYVLWKSGYIVWTAMVARARTPSQCLWIWIPYSNPRGLSAGSYAC